MFCRTNKNSDSIGQFKHSNVSHCLALLALILLLGSVTHYCHSALIRQLTKESQTDSFSLPDWHALKALSLGFDQLLADCYWLAFVQYIGDTKARELDHYHQAYEYLDLIIGLDPTFTETYSFAAFIVGAENHNPELADSLIQRGIKANPNDWYIPFIAGVNQYLYGHNEKKAASYYRQASHFPNAPTWLSRQADILEKEIPSTIKLINTWNNVYSSNEAGAVKDQAKEKLIALWLKVFQESPTPSIRIRATQELEALGVSIKNIHP